MILSIIIAAYNVQKFIAKCIDSCIDIKHLKDYEIIVVNDGSTDNTEDILKSYLKYKNFTYFNKRNGGISSARNFGLKKATGKYLFFLDGDDFLERNCIEVLLKDCTLNYDLITYNFYKHSQQLKEIGFNNEILFGEINNKEQLINLLFTQNYLKSNWSPWGKLYKKDIISFNSLFFNEENYGSEDLLFNLNLFCYINNTYSSKEILVNYRIDNNLSITKNVKPQTILSLLNVLKFADDLMSNYKFSKVTTLNIYTNLSLWFLYCLKRLHILNKQERKIFYNYKYLKKILRKSSMLKIKLCFIFITFFGLKITNFLLRSRCLHG